MIRKIERMWFFFGKKDGRKCKDCCHFKGEKGSYKKCELYSKSHSEASDWLMSYDACGLFNKDYNGIPVIKLTIKEPKVEEQIEGQMSIFDFMGEIAE